MINPSHSMITGTILSYSLCSQQCMYSDLTSATCSLLCLQCHVHINLGSVLGKMVQQYLKAKDPTASDGKMRIRTAISMENLRNLADRERKLNAKPGEIISVSPSAKDSSSSWFRRKKISPSSKSTSNLSDVLENGGVLPCVVEEDAKREEEEEAKRLLKESLEKEVVSDG